MIRWAAEQGHDKVVRVLLRDKRVDPTAEDNFCLQIACSKGYSRLLELLLRDKRCDPSKSNSIALWIAAESGFLDCVELLVQDRRIDLNAKHDNLTALEVALLNENFEVGQYLLQCSKTESLSGATAVHNKASFASDTQNTDTNVNELDAHFNTISPLYQSSPLDLQSKDINEIQPSSTSVVSKSCSYTNEKTKNNENENENNQLVSTLPVVNLQETPAEIIPIVTASGKSQVNNHSIEKDAETEIFGLVHRRKYISIHEFQIRLSDLKTITHKLENVKFNALLIHLLDKNTCADKHQERGTTYKFAAEIMCNFSPNQFAIDSTTIQIYRNAFSFPKQCFRTLFKMRESQNPVKLLIDFHKQELSSYHQ